VISLIATPGLIFVISVEFRPGDTVTSLRNKSADGKFSPWHFGVPRPIVEVRVPFHFTMELSHVRAVLRPALAHIGLVVDDLRPATTKMTPANPHYAAHVGGCGLND
jgi:hypothetical protein